MRYPLLGLLLVVLSVASTAIAQEPGWSGQIIARGAQRARLQAMPIERRPYRPLHFYGNTIRRRYYRGTVVPTRRVVVRGYRR